MPSGDSVAGSASTTPTPAGAVRRRDWRSGAGMLASMWAGAGIGGRGRAAAAFGVARGRSSSATISASSCRITKRFITFSSSRMLPGHEWLSSASVSAALGFGAGR